MILLRLLSVLAAGLVLIVAPITLDPLGHGMPGVLALLSLLCTALVAGSFVFVAYAAPRMRRRPAERKLGGMLLLIPAVFALALLVKGKDAGLLCAGGLLLGFTVVLLANVLFPDALGHSRTRLRGRPARVEPSML